MLVAQQLVGKGTILQFDTKLKNSLENIEFSMADVMDVREN